VRAASSGENSTSSQILGPFHRIDRALDDFGFNSIFSLNADGSSWSQERRAGGGLSLLKGLAGPIDIFVRGSALSPQILGPRSPNCRATACTASKSPGGSHRAIPLRSRPPPLDQGCATSSFLAVFMLQPGDCSPSRSVVSR